MVRKFLEIHCYVGALRTAANLRWITWCEVYSEAEGKQIGQDMVASSKDCIGWNVRTEGN